MKYGKRIFSVMASLAAQWWAQAQTAELDREVMIEAIARIETGNDWRAVGRLGERGRCQFMARTWREYSRIDFRTASVDCDESRRVERAHLDRICRTLRETGLPVDAGHVAAAWRFGASMAARFVRSDSAQRTVNTYRELLRERRARK